MNTQSIYVQHGLKLALMSAFAIAGATIGSTAGAVEGTAATSATVMVPMTITKSKDLTFGKFAVGATGGTVVVDTDGGRSATGDVILPTGSNTGLTAAKFDIGGEISATYAITYAAATPLTHTDATTTMVFGSVISNLTGAAGASAAVATGTLDSSGAQSLYIGGTLTVGGAQKPGVYAGVLKATVEYN
jgi:hypothetical protein